MRFRKLKMTVPDSFHQLCTMFCTINKCSHGNAHTMCPPLFKPPPLRVKPTHVGTLLFWGKFSTHVRDDSETVSSPPSASWDFSLPSFLHSTLKHPGNHSPGVCKHTCQLSARSLKINLTHIVPLGGFCKQT